MFISERFLCCTYKSVSFMLYIYIQTVYNGPNEERMAG